MNKFDKGVGGLISQAKEIRKKLLKIMYKSGGSHIGGSLSCVDILTVLYFKVLSVKRSMQRDRFILSKGHAVAALYSVLCEKGFFSTRKLYTYCGEGSTLAGHSTLNSAAGIESTTGSLGHGLSIGAGMALAGKNDKRKYKVFVLMGDGECNEGSVWEAALFAAQHKLDNLVAIIDNNKLQGLGEGRHIMNLEPLEKKWQSFGWSTQRVDGHNFKELDQALSSVPFQAQKPSILIADTVKGKGISFMEGRYEWHYKSLNLDQYNQGVKETDEKYCNKNS